MTTENQAEPQQEGDIFDHVPATGGPIKEYGPTDDDRAIWEKIQARKRAEEAPEPKAEEPEEDEDDELEDEPSEEDLEESAELEEDEDDEEDDDDDEDDELDAALRALRRAKLPKTALDKLDRDEVVAMAEQYARVQATAEDNYRALRELQKETEREEEEPESEPVSAAPVEPVSFADMVEPLQEEFGEEATKRLMGALERIRDHQARVIEESNSVRDAQLEQVQRMATQVLVSSQRSRLEALYEGVDEETFDAVAVKANVLAHTGEYDSVDDAFDDAFRLVVRNPVDRRKAEKKRTRERERYRERQAAQPSTSSKVADANAPMTPEEKDRAVFEFLVNGGDVAGAKKLIGG